MKRVDKEEDVRARSLAYRQGLVRVLHAIAGFRDLTGVDLQGDIDTAGRHMGEAPYLKLTAERLVEITALLARLSGDDDEPTADAAVLSLDNPEANLVLSAYRPGRTS